MDSWKRFRLLACIVGMLGIVVVGSLARIVWGVPPAPYGVRVSGTVQFGGMRPIPILEPRRVDPFADLMGL